MTGASNIQEIVERPNPIVAFDKVAAEIAAYKEENANLVFAYDTPQGEKDARSHIFKLRQVKSKIAAIHKEVKAEALAVCKAIDSKKNSYTKDVEEMIEVHLAPINLIAEERHKAEQEKLEAERLAREKAEQERLDQIKKQEEEVARKEATVQAEQDKLKREQEIFEAEKKAEANAKLREQAAKEQAKIDQMAALARAEQEKIDAVAAEKERAHIAAEAKEVAEQKRAADEKAEQERLGAIEQKRIANKKHRDSVERAIQGGICKIVKDESVAAKILVAIKKGEIKHITINY